MALVFKHFGSCHSSVILKLKFELKIKIFSKERVKILLPDQGRVQLRKKSLGFQIKLIDFTQEKKLLEKM